MAALQQWLQQSKSILSSQKYLRGGMSYVQANEARRPIDLIEGGQPSNPMSKLRNYFDTLAF